MTCAFVKRIRLLEAAITCSHPNCEYEDVVAYERPEDDPGESSSNEALSIASQSLGWNTYGECPEHAEQRAREEAAE